jgi:hypothetical protein
MLAAVFGKGFGQVGVVSASEDREPVEPDRAVGLSAA